MAATASTSNQARNKPSQAKWLGYVLALRPWSFAASFIPVLLGSVLSYNYNYNSTQSFSWPIFLLTVIVTLSVHGAGNLVNTYYDFHRGVDYDGADDRTLIDHLLTADEVVRFGAILYTIACFAFAVIVCFSQARMEVLAFVFFGGLSGSFQYTGGFGFKYYALGDIMIFVSFGPIAVLFAFIAQAGVCVVRVVYYAIPLVLITEAILHSNNARDLESDKRAGIITLAIILGYKRSYILYVILLFTPYLIFACMAIISSPFYALPLITLYGGLNLEKQFRQGNLRKLPVETARLNLLLGIMYVLSCFLTGDI
ncbi:UbiA prenyltransferase domain-containing protein 1 [Trichoplax sp. H2]|nr:UbiA prenyltransferase domain-containing protein 1 [Trichoplax sp. H2]|eukprot:RDD44255.1 UbiA prenyltransferase domain-containing protein 1 [Trichoplax sp. H2]